MSQIKDKHEGAPSDQIVDWIASLNFFQPQLCFLLLEWSNKTYASWYVQ